ncbi:Propionate catabolism operon regulatory protein PrpR [Salmonella enterica subsp. enterica]|nr:Propionate catabolism operon regulatory protein PrpR [Salmonella enterica subsp. enterica]
MAKAGRGKRCWRKVFIMPANAVNGPFVAINCGAMAPQILESELFGYVAGAFTGASPKGKIGLFELAHHGTIFWMRLASWINRYRRAYYGYCRKRQIMRLGSDQMIPVDIRVIAATNQTLTKLIADGTFREDLYYRLNVLKVTTIPLRKRPEDIKAIGLSLLTSFSQHYKRPALTLTPALWQELQRFAWPRKRQAVKQYYRTAWYSLLITPRQRWMRVASCWTIWKRGADASQLPATTARCWLAIIKRFACVF